MFANSRVEGGHVSWNWTDAAMWAALLGIAKPGHAIAPYGVHTMQPVAKKLSRSTCVAWLAAKIGAAGRATAACPAMRAALKSATISLARSGETVNMFVHVLCVGGDTGAMNEFAADPVKYFGALVHNLRQVFSEVPGQAQLLRLPRDGVLRGAVWAVNPETHKLMSATLGDSIGNEHRDVTAARLAVTDSLVEQTPHGDDITKFHPAPVAWRLGDGKALVLKIAETLGLLSARATARTGAVATVAKVIALRTDATCLAIASDSCPLKVASSVFDEIVPRIGRSDAVDRMEDMSGVCDAFSQKVIAEDCVTVSASGAAASSSLLAIVTSDPTRRVGDLVGLADAQSVRDDLQWCVEHASLPGEVTELLRRHGLERIFTRICTR